VCLPHVESIAKAMETEEIILITVLERVVNLTPKSTTRKPSGAAPENWTDIASVTDLTLQNV